MSARAILLFGCMALNVMGLRLHDADNETIVQVFGHGILDASRKSDIEDAFRIAYGHYEQRSDRHLVR